MKNLIGKLALPAIALVAIGGLAACGSDDEDTVTGSFQPAPDPPAGYADLSGEAELTRSDDGSVASLQLSGLQPDTEYIAHIHAGVCDQPDSGGPHYKFDPAGSDMPPNEIHLPFTSTGDGTGEAEASSDRVPDGEGQSMVVHLADTDAMSHEDAMEKDGEAMEHEDDAMKKDGEAMEHGEAMSDDGHGGHSHPPKIACADLGDGEGDTTQEQTVATSTQTSTTAIPSGPTIVVRNGEPVGGVRELDFDSGERVNFWVQSNEPAHVHVHGYDLYGNVPAGGTFLFGFDADIQGVFEVELEERAVQIAELRVNP